MNVRCDMVSVYVVRPTLDGRGHEFLQLRRAAGDYMGGTFQTIRGQSDPGETAWQAALRELREEAGLVPREFYRLGTCEVFYIPGPPDDPHAETIWHCPAFCAVVARDDAVRLNEEHDAHRWIPRADALGAFMWASERPALEEVCREVLDDGPSKPYLRMPLS